MKSHNQISWQKRKKKHHYYSVQVIHPLKRIFFSPRLHSFLFYPLFSLFLPSLCSGFPSFLFSTSTASSSSFSLPATKAQSGEPSSYFCTTAGWEKGWWQLFHKVPCILDQYIDLQAENLTGQCDRQTKIGMGTSSSTCLTGLLGPEILFITGYPKNKHWLLCELCHATIVC